MTHFIGRIQMYDVMADITATIEVLDYDDPEERGRVVYQASVTVPGVGQEDPREWARQVCSQLLRAYP